MINQFGECEVCGNCSAPVCGRCASATEAAITARWTRAEALIEAYAKAVEAFELADAEYGEQLANGNHKHMPGAYYAAEEEKNRCEEALIDAEQGLLSYGSGT